MTNGEEGSSIKGIPTVSNPDMEAIRTLTNNLDYKVGIITRDLGLSSGLNSKALLGVACGAIFAIVMVGIPIVLKFFY
ncbi:tetrahydromethanopterin S-methyltransferase subunit F [Methanothermococcus sp.]|uniref:tetrahydromethanopterin S-methyltransferase subunit F n=1 Tax=Methanothermococcus sp. TaxID=2614238 RepID=UPI0025D30E02|nr:tetrahydromethanopterin S-methyltransferase subunit F [Methanothermococcus sp.]